MARLDEEAKALDSNDKLRPPLDGGGGGRWLVITQTSNNEIIIGCEFLSEYREISMDESINK